MEQAAFVQDQVRFGNWTINAGVRWDHYQLLVNRQDGEPALRCFALFPLRQLGITFFLRPRLSDALVREHPAFEFHGGDDAGHDLSSNCLSSLPKETTYEAGLTKVFLKKFKLDANYFERYVNNYADDDQIENTTISFPIAFRKAIIYGAEGKLDFPESHGFSGFLSYSYEVGNAWFPVTGGLFLGDDAEIPYFRPLPGFAGSTEHRPWPRSLSGCAARLDCRGHSI